MERQKITPRSSDSQLDAHKEKNKKSYWKDILNQYEKKYEALERRQAALAERVTFMECALPSLLLISSAKNSLRKEESKHSKSTFKLLHKFDNDINEIKSNEIITD